MRHKDPELMNRIKQYISEYYLENAGAMPTIAQEYSRRWNETGRTVLARGKTDTASGQTVDYSVSAHAGLYDLEENGLFYNSYSSFNRLFSSDEEDECFSGYGMPEKELHFLLESLDKDQMLCFAENKQENAHCILTMDDKIFFSDMKKKVHLFKDALFVKYGKGCILKGIFGWRRKMALVKKK